MLKKFLATTIGPGNVLRKIESQWNIIKCVPENAETGAETSFS